MPANEVSRKHISYETLSWSKKSKLDYVGTILKMKV